MMIEDFLEGNFEGTVVIQTKAEVNLTARDWQLYTFMEGVDFVADELNRAATEALSCGDLVKGSQIFTAAQQKYFEFGAFDSEPSGVFRSLFTKVYREPWY